MGVKQRVVMSWRKNIRCEVGIFLGVLKFAMNFYRCPANGLTSATGA